MKEILATSLAKAMSYSQYQLLFKQLVTRKELQVSLQMKKLSIPN